LFYYYALRFSKNEVCTKAPERRSDEDYQLISVINLSNFYLGALHKFHASRGAAPPQCNVRSWVHWKVLQIWNLYRSGQ